MKKHNLEPYFTNVEETRTRSVKRSKFTKNSAFNTTDYTKLPKNVKFITSVTKKRSTRNEPERILKRALPFVQSLQKTPLYLIHAHSCICPETGICQESATESSFEIPPDTYFINMAQAGDVTCIRQLSLLLHADEYRKFLLVHSQSDTVPTPSIGVSKFAFFSGVSRATSPYTTGEKVMYPNINFSMNEHDAMGKDITDPLQNENGVFNLDKLVLRKKDYRPPSLNNSHSLLPQDLKRKNWFLHDIVESIYKKTGIRRGIFVLAGCQSVCNPDMKGADLDYAAGMIYRANVMYPSLRETFTKDELKTIENLYVKKTIKKSTYSENTASQLYPPSNYGVFHPITTISTEEVKNMAERDVTDPRVFKRLPALIHKENFGDVRNYMKKYK